MPSFYIESSAISYLAAGPSADAVVRERQSQTRIWFEGLGPNVDFYISEVVLEEISDGDDAEALRRLELVRGMTSLLIDAEIDSFASELMRRIGLPPRLRPDAMHMAFAAITRIEYLVTWNMKHMANPAIVVRYRRLCSERGIPCPSIVTPLQLLEVDDGGGMDF